MDKSSWRSKAGVWAPHFDCNGGVPAGLSSRRLNDGDDEAVAFTGIEVVGGDIRHGTALVATRDEGGAWSAPLIVSNQASSSRARIALDNSGNAIMTFFEAGLLTGNPVEAVARPAGGSWSTPILISSPTDFASSPNLVATSAGTFVARWMSGQTASPAIRPIGQTAFEAPAVLSSANGPTVFGKLTLIFGLRQVQPQFLRCEGSLASDRPLPPGPEPARRRFR